MECTICFKYDSEYLEQCGTSLQMKCQIKLPHSINHRLCVNKHVDTNVSIYTEEIDDATP
jgi:hypothetical protein